MKQHRVLEETKKYFEKIELPQTIVFFVSTSVNNSRGTVWQTQGQSFEKTWTKVIRYISRFKMPSLVVKIEVISTFENISKNDALKQISEIQRNNYFPYGISFKSESQLYILPEEIVGNALFVPEKEHRVGRNAAKMSPSENNIKQFIKRRLKKNIYLPNYIGEEWTFFKKQGVIIEGNQWYPLENAVTGGGMRVINVDNHQVRISQAVAQGTNYLYNQINQDGSFIYGYFPAYGKIIPGYNSVRHFSSLYALLEAYEYQDDSIQATDILSKIEASIDWGIKHLSIAKESNLFVIEPTKNGNELKLGAQAMVILALAKYEEVTKNQIYRGYMNQFLSGMTYFIKEDGETIHVLDEALQEKQKFRIIYYDGEALFALMRAYSLVNDSKILDLGEVLMTKFIRKNYAKYHDHWLSYSVNELTQYVPKREYFAFGVKNALENLNFINHRDTAYPTMLELLVAGAKMFERIEASPEMKDLITAEDKDQLHQVMTHRAIHELKTGVMWPEFAMYFAEPQVVTGGFYARHDRCRMRIDDAEHFLSGLINYQRFMDEQISEQIKFATIG